MSEFVDIEAVEREVGNFVNKPAILCAQAEVVCDVEIGAAAIHEGAAGLPLRAGHDELLSRIEDQCSAAAQDIRPDAPHVNGNARDECTRHFVKIRLRR